MPRDELCLVPTLMRSSPTLSEGEAMATCGWHLSYDSDCTQCRESDRHADLKKQRERHHREMLDRADRAERRRQEEQAGPPEKDSSAWVLIGLVVAVVVIAGAIMLVAFAASALLYVAPLLAAVLLVLERVRPDWLPFTLDRRLGGYLRLPLLAAGAVSLIALVLRLVGAPGDVLWLASLPVLGLWIWWGRRRDRRMLPPSEDHDD